jgi:hypothetical protein
MSEVQGIETEAGFKWRVRAYVVAIVILFPAAIIVVVIGWMTDGGNARDAYWEFRPKPKNSLRKLREEEKWPYVRNLESRVADLEGLLETTDVVIRRKINEAIEQVDFTEALRPAITAGVAAAALKIRQEAHPAIVVGEITEEDRARLVATARAGAGAGEVVPLQEEHKAEEHAEIPAGAIGEAVAAAALHYVEQGGDVDPDLQAALARLRAGGGDTA